MSFKDYDKKTFIADTAAEFASRRISKRDFLCNPHARYYFGPCDRNSDSARCCVVRARRCIQCAQNKNA